MRRNEETDPRFLSGLWAPADPGRAFAGASRRRLRRKERERNSTPQLLHMRLVWNVRKQANASSSATRAL